MAEPPLNEFAPWFFCSNSVLYEVQSHTLGEDLFVVSFVTYSVSLINVVIEEAKDKWDL